MFFKTISVFLAMLTCLLFGGCGGGSSGHPTTYKVSGSVKNNGTAVDGATVMFQLMEGKESAVGSTDAKGEFSLSTFAPNDGAVPGQYKISITKYSTPPVGAKQLVPGQIQSGDLGDSYGGAPSGKDGSGDGSPKNLLPAKYANDQTSALRATVTSSGPNRFDFDLK